MIYVTNKEWKELNDIIFKLEQEQKDVNFGTLIDLIFVIDYKNTIKNSKPNADQFKDLGDCV